MHIQALYSADVILPGSSSKLRLLVINLASVPGRQFVNSPTAQSLKRYVPLYDDTFRMTKTFFILTFFILTTLTSCGQTKLNKTVVMQALDFAYLEGCETGKGDCKPIEIVRQSRKDSVLLIFPSGGTQSDVYLHSAKDKSFELHDQRFSGQGKPTLNLTNLDDGEYSANIISCGLGGSCLVRLKTKHQ